MGTGSQNIEDRVTQMDAHLRQFCDDNQGFIRVALGGVESRLTGRLKKFESRVTAGFQVVDQRLTRMEGDIAGMKGDIAAMKGDIAAMKGDIAEIKMSLKALAPPIASTRGTPTRAKARRRR